MLENQLITRFSSPRMSTPPILLPKQAPQLAKYTSQLLKKSAQAKPKGLLQLFCA